MRTARAFAAVLVVGVVTVLGPIGAIADCAQPTADFLLDEVAGGGRSVFLGEVEEGGDRTLARVRVEQVWSGPDLAERVWVRTGAEQPPWPLSRLLPVRSSVDADLVLGERYLIGVSDDFATDSCSSLVADGDVVAAAPSGARPPSADGLPGHRRGPFDTALGAAVLGAVVVGLLMAWWGRRSHDGSGSVGRTSGRGRLVRGAAAGAVVGVAWAGVAELAATATRQLFPTDVGIVGFATVFGVPVAVVVGALLWWWGRPARVAPRLWLAAAPVVLVGAVQVALQWSAQ